MNPVISITLLLSDVPRTEGDQPDSLPGEPEPSTGLPS
uniref:Thy-1 cell surface antigen n=1 Tax=Rattus norvegicus TaxID=10116 RepID=A0ABK0M6S4_RAT